MEYKTRRFLRAIEDRYQKSLLRSSSELQEVRFAAALASEIRRSGHADRGEAVGGAPEKFGRSVQNVSDSRPSRLQEARAVPLATVLLCPQTDQTDSIRYSTAVSPDGFHFRNKTGGNGFVAGVVVERSNRLPYSDLLMVLAGRIPNANSGKFGLYEVL